MGTFWDARTKEYSILGVYIAVPTYGNYHMSFRATLGFQEEVHEHAEPCSSEIPPLESTSWRVAPGKVKE